MPSAESQTAPPGTRQNLATAQEVADYCGVALSTVYAWSHYRRGPKLIKVGRALRARWSDLDAWLDENTVGAA